MACVCTYTCIQNDDFAKSQEVLGLEWKRTEKNIASQSHVFPLDTLMGKRVVPFIYCLQHGVWRGRHFDVPASNATATPTATSTTTPKRSKKTKKTDMEDASAADDAGKNDAADTKMAEE
jgi:hypothetical protein